MCVVTYLGGYAVEEVSDFSVVAAVRIARLDGGNLRADLRVLHHVDVRDVADEVRVVVVLVDYLDVNFGEARSGRRKWNYIYYLC